MRCNRKLHLQDVRHPVIQQRLRIIDAQVFAVYIDDLGFIRGAAEISLANRFIGTLLPPSGRSMTPRSGFLPGCAPDRCAESVGAAVKSVVVVGSVSAEEWARTSSDQPVKIFTLSDARLRVRIIEYGARIVSIDAPDRRGQTAVRS